jgi:hypothetical protein
MVERPFKLFKVSVCFVILCLLIAGNQAFAQNNSVNPQITIGFHGVSIEKALTRLETEKSVLLSYDPAIIPDTKKIDADFTNKPLFEILDFILNGTNLSYKTVDAELVIFKNPVKLETVSGHIRDRQTGEDIIGANIYISSINHSESSNNYGFYSITIPKGNYEISITHIGYKTIRIPVHLEVSISSFDILLEQQSVSLNEVAVHSDNESYDSKSQLKPEQTLNLDEFKKLPYYKGEADVIKDLQTQSGIVGMTEGSSGLFVRGGNKDQNLILLDEAIIYNPAHLFGLTSIFNPDAIKNIQIYKDDIPANYGGRLSSVIDTRMADGDDENFHIKGGVSLLSARLAAEGPIVKDKGSFLFTFRKSLSNLLYNDFQLLNLRASYYDVNFKINYRINSSNRIFYSAYLGSDHLYSSNSYFNNWGNQTSTFRWNHLFNSKLFFNLSLIYSNYKNQLDINADSAKGTYRWQTGIKDVTMKGDFIFYKKPGNELKFGFSGIMHLFIPGEVIGKDTSGNIPRATAAEYAVYLSDRISLGDRFDLLAGLRASMFQNIATDKLFILNSSFENVNNESNLNGVYKTYGGLEPRLLFQYKINADDKLQMVYNRTYQYLQLVQNDELAYSSLETWIPASPNIKPQQADMFSLNYLKILQPFNFSVSAYYKKFLNQLDLIDHAQIILNPIIESQLRPGTSEAYGTEFVISKNKGKFNGTLSYTWSRVFRQIDYINNGIQYPADYDIPNDLKATISYNITERLSVTSFFTYTSGRPVTLPVGYYTQDGIKVPIFEGRNLSRFPDYHRLDINFELKPQQLNLKRNHFTGTLDFGVYNLYGQKNPLFYNISQNATIDNLGYAQAFSGIEPTISYTFKF